MIGRKIYDCMIREERLYEAIVELFFFIRAFSFQFNETKALFVFASLREERKVKRLKLTL